jgi:WXG100 family type VII secretion target
MPGPTRGGDTDQMRTRLARTFGSNAGQLSGIIRDLNGAATDSEQIWKGPAADQFREAWQEARPQFDRMREALENAKRSIEENARLIEEATNRRG